MKIRSHPPLARSPVYEPQARFLATCIRKLEKATQRALGDEYDAWEASASRFWALPEYEVFHDAAYACGFVCNDLAPNFPIDIASKRPQEQLGNTSFNQLRLYVHTLLRAERANAMEGYFSPVLQALNCGALDVLAYRLERDESIYEELGYPPIHRGPLK